MRMNYAHINDLNIVNIIAIFEFNAEVWHIYAVYDLKEHSA